MALAPSAAAARAYANARSEPPPVASLQPKATAKLWQRLVHRRSLRARASADCRPLRGVFYAPTDWLRLATKLAANASPCAQYYISIPPIVGDKTRLRPDAAWRIRALGPNFHAMAEIHFATWSKWVASTGSSWFDAGTTAREHMVTAGYDVTKGDTWAVNELSTAVRRNTGNARANIREFLRGLYEGDGTHPTQGTAFIVGVGQQTTDVSQYQNNLQNWFSDTAFWTDMSTYVSDWSQETYGDVRNYAVPGAPISQRRDYLNDYLQHEIVLANAGPSTIETARAYIQSAYSPLANAAWERESGYGWTMVPSADMAGYVSAQVYAMRYFTAKSGEPQDHWGFAWAPRNGSGLSSTDFANQTNAILDRLGAAIRDSAQTDVASNPGSAACGPGGQNVSCVGDLQGAHFNDAWKAFQVWSQPLVTFTTPPQTIQAGTPSGPITLGLTSSKGAPFTATAPVSVTVVSNSPQGTFSTSPGGPWSSTISLTIPAGSSSSGAFYYLDTHSGSAVLTASAPNFADGLQVETITPGPVLSLSVSPASGSVRARGTRAFTALGRDTFGNVFPVASTWSLAPRRLGSLSPASGSATTFTALRAIGNGTITASVATEAGPISASAAVNVTPARLRITVLHFQTRGRAVFVSLLAVDPAGQSISRARVSLVVLWNGRRFYAKRVTTGAAGRVSLRLPTRQGGCFTTTITGVTAVGFTWDGHTPRNRICRPRSRH
jgi:hypothetical protein